MIRYSATKLNTYKMCPFRYYLTYILKLPTPTMPAFMFGDAVHKALQDFQNWAKSNKTISMYHDKAREILQQRLTPISADDMYEVGITKPFVYDYYVAEYIDYFIEKRIYERVYETEKALQLEFGDIKLTGSIDLFISPDIIIDFKTSKYVPSVAKLVDEFQTRIYSLTVPHEVNMMYIYLRKPMKIRSMVIGTPNNTIQQEILQYSQLIQTAKEWPKKYDMCNLCPFKQDCRSGKLKDPGATLPGII